LKLPHAPLKVQLAMSWVSDLPWCRELPIGLISILLCACAPLSGTQRVAVSTSDCVRAAVAGQLPSNVSDKHAHCHAAALIARHCSATEAYLAGLGKEWLDLLGSGDAEWGDLRADWAGVRCARARHGDVMECCGRLQSYKAGESLNRQRRSR
jgi:hypothetical protein